MYGTLDLEDGNIQLAAGQAGNQAYFRSFLQTLQKAYTHHDDLFVIIDRARYHFLPEQELTKLKAKPRLHFVYLPPYSPECNPIEQLWRMMKGSVANKFYQNIFSLLWDALDWHKRFQPGLCLKYQQLARG